MPTGGIDLSGGDKNGEKRRYLLLAYVVMTVVRWDISLVQISIGCHCFPGPSGVIGDSVYVVPVIPGARGVYHTVYVGLEACTV